MQLLKNVGANCIFAAHCAVVVIIGFGWLLPNIWYFYMLVLIVTPLSELSLGYCFLSKWEFDLRKALDPELNYDYGFSSYYTYRLTHQRLSQKFIQNAAFIFLVGSIAINIYFKVS